MAGSSGDSGQYGGRNVSGARMWLEVGETDDSMVRTVSGARMLLEVGETGNCMVEAMSKEPGCGWR